MLIPKEIDKILPEKTSFELKALALDGNAEEIRLRIGSPTQVVCDNGEAFSPYIITDQDIYYSLLRACNYSIFAHQDEISSGFITIENGHRIGICGASPPKAGTRTTFLSYTSLNIRISKKVFTCANAILPYIIHNGSILNTLIISPPRCGKTTALRDIIRILSDTYKKKVCVADERTELCGLYPLGSEYGIRTDTISGMKKSDAMDIFVRSMSPDVIITDEIGTSQDAISVANAAKCGVSVIASAHSSCTDEIKNRTRLSSLFEDNVFERYIVLTRKEKPGILAGVYDKHFDIIFGGEHALL